MASGRLAQPHRPTGGEFVATPAGRTNLARVSWQRNVLGASWKRLGGALGGISGRLEASWGVLERLGAVLGRLGTSWEQQGPTNFFRVGLNTRPTFSELVATPDQLFRSWSQRPTNFFGVGRNSRGQDQVSSS